MENGKDVEKWLLESEYETVTIDGYGTCSKKELEYYYKKYLFLKEDGHFDAIDREKLVSGGFNADDIKESLANVRQVTFEITDRCNLQCEYCGYGKFYNDYDKRKNKDMDISIAVRLIDFLQKLWNSPLNHSHDRRISFGFYGGEPLCNFSFIREFTRYLGQLNLIHNRVGFTMTTNGLLIDKYMDFLVANNFRLLISLDGNEQNNRYRVYKNGKPAFGKILENVRALQSKYPRYFKEKVNFNAVLHNENSVSDIFSYFKQEFDKIPRISALNTSGINDAHREAFWKTYSNVTESLYNSEDYSFIEKEMFIRLPNIQDIGLFLLKGLDFSFDNYTRLLNPVSEQVHPPTGTCVPFSRKIFMSVNGKIFPCERVSHRYMLGRVDSHSVKIDYKSIAEKYKTWYDRMRKQCSACYNAGQCLQCMFSLDHLETNPGCNGFMTEKDYSRHLAAYVDFLENKPGIYREIFSKVLVD